MTDTDTVCLIITFQMKVIYITIPQWEPVTDALMILTVAAAMRQKTGVAQAAIVRVEIITGKIPLHQQMPNSNPLN